MVVTVVVTVVTVVMVTVMVSVVVTVVTLVVTVVVTVVVVTVMVTVVVVTTCMASSLVGESTSMMGPAGRPGTGLSYLVEGKSQGRKKIELNSGNSTSEWP